MSFSNEPMVLTSYASREETVYSSLEGGYATEAYVCGFALMADSSQLADHSFRSDALQVLEDSIRFA
jgi:hypothetical protein